MSEEMIPEKIDPFRFADNAVRLKGVLPIVHMHRLCESLCRHAGEINVDIQFGKNEQGIRFVSGDVSGALELQCQRCMDPLKHDVALPFWFAIAESEKEAETFPEGYDVIVVKDDILVIQDLVEDELIVELPLVPMHDPRDCKVSLPLIIESGQPAEMEKENPFKVIESLRDSKRDPNK